MTKDLKISNIKGLLIFLVVFGHLIELYKGDFKELYLLIYTFHMPLFIFISGYLAKHASFKKVANFLLIYLLFQPTYRCFFFVFNLDLPYELNMKVPYFQLWYLLSMAAWYLLAIGFMKYKLKKWQKITLGISLFTLGLASRFLTVPFVSFINHYDPEFYSYTFSYQRTLTFLPFFFIGLMFNQTSMKRLQKSLRAKWITSIISIGVIYLFYMFTNTNNTEKVLKGSYGINKLKGPVSIITWQLILGYLFAIIMCFIILNIVSNRKCFLTKLGDHSMPVYLFHAFFVILIKKIDFLSNLSPAVLIGVLFVTAVIITGVLSSNPFVNATYTLCNPYEGITKTFRKIKVALT